MCLGLAVSGGGDSMAMLHLAVGLGMPLRVVTVDHGLRAEAAEEAAEVGRVCASLGVSHDVLRWHWDGHGNLQDAARRGRRLVISDWARTAGVYAVALAHTRDDVAETFVMRLARGAGVDGLSAMAGQWVEGGVTWMRPLLGASRGELREYLRGAGLAWVEDPSNDNDRFDRVRVRKALVGLGALGLTAERLAEVAGHMAQARDALERATDAASIQTLSVNGNAVCISALDLADETPEVQRRLIQRVIAHVAPSDYGPRGPAVQSLLARLLMGKSGTLAGCRFVADAKRHCHWAFREARAVADLTCPPDQFWDGQWRIIGPAPDGAELRALNHGITLTPWRDTGLPRAALLASPALWLGDHLIAAPHAGFGPLHSVISPPGAAALHHSAITH